MQKKAFGSFGASPQLLIYAIAGFIIMALILLVVYYGWGAVGGQIVSILDAVRSKTVG